MSSPASRTLFRFASLEQPQHPDAAAGDAVAVSPFVFEEFAGGLLDERGVVVCHSKGGAQTNQKGMRNDLEPKLARIGRVASATSLAASRLKPP